MAYFYNSIDKEAVRAFIYEDLKILGIKIPKLEKIAKAGRTSLVQVSERVNKYYNKRMIMMRLRGMTFNDDVELKI